MYFYNYCEISSTDRVCYQHYENRLEQEKGRPNVNVCTAEENLEEPRRYN